MGKWIVSRDKWIASRDKWIASRDKWIASRDKWIVSRDKWIVSRDKWIVSRSNSPFIAEPPQEASGGNSERGASCRSSQPLTADS